MKRIWFGSIVIVDLSTPGMRGKTLEMA